MTRNGLGLDMQGAFVLAMDTGFNFQPAVTFSAITACWVSKLSFFITLTRLVSGRWQKATLWFLMMTSTGSLIVQSVLQAFTECGTRVPWLFINDDWDGIPYCTNRKMTRAFSMYASIYAIVMVSLRNGLLAYTHTCSLSTFGVASLTRFFTFT